jgi:hypothetical protein
MIHFALVEAAIPRSSTVVGGATGGLRVRALVNQRHGGRTYGHISEQ